MKNEKINRIKAEIDSLEETSEGQLRGGFSIIGGINPLVEVNGGCNNHGCNVGCGHTNTGTCSNDGCNNNCPTSPVSGQNPSSIGMTFAF